MQSKKERIRTRILLPFGVGFALLVGFLIFSDYFYVHRPEINRDVYERLDGLQEMFQLELDNDAELFSAMIGFIQKDEILQKAWLEKDREALLSRASPILEDIRAKHRVTHFYFIDVDKLCFLRVHNPPRHGDLITRYTTARAAEKGEPAHGIELGPYGTFTLRVVHPWRVDGELVGYIELGEEVEHLTPRLSQTLGVDLVILIKKELLEWGKWVEGLRMTGRTGDWDQFAEFVVIDKTLEKIPPKIGAYLESHEEEHEGEETVADTAEGAEDIEKKYALFNLTVGNRAYRAGFQPLLDARGTDVGEIVLLYDVTESEAEVRTLTKTQILVSVLIGGAIFLLFYFYVGRLEWGLTSARKILEKEIEERRQAEKAVRKSGEFLQTIVDSVSEPLMVIGLDHRIVMANRAGRRLAGGKDPVANGMTCYELSHRREIPCDETEHQCPLEEVLATKTPTTVIHTHYDAQGNETIVEVSAAPIFDEKGEVTRVIEWSHDITERRRMEEERQILGKKMQETQKLESLGVMAGGIAHHFNNILQIILGNADLLLEQIGKDSPQTGMVREIEKAARRAADLSAQMLTYSGQGLVLLESLSLTRVVREMSQLLEISIPETVRFEQQLADPLPPISADAAQIRQVIINLLTNASEAVGEEKPGAIVVSTGAMECKQAYFSDTHPNRELPDGQYVYFEVSDSGCGMDEEIKEKIFEPFFSTKFTGRGLGLAAVLAIVRGHHGAIKLSSEPERGTVIRVLFPAFDGKRRQDAAE